MERHYFQWVRSSIKRSTNRSNFKIAILVYCYCSLESLRNGGRRQHVASSLIHTVHKMYLCSCDLQNSQRTPWFIHSTKWSDLIISQTLLLPVKIIIHQRTSLRASANMRASKKKIRQNHRKFRQKLLKVKAWKSLKKKPLSFPAVQYSGTCHVE